MKKGNHIDALHFQDLGRFQKVKVSRKIEFPSFFFFQRNIGFQLQNWARCLYFSFLPFIRAQKLLRQNIAIVSLLLLLFLSRRKWPRMTQFGHERTRARYLSIYIYFNNASLVIWLLQRALPNGILFFLVVKILNSILPLKWPLFH